MTADDFLQAFFGPGNRFALAAIRRRDADSEWLLPWVALLEGEHPTPTVLPVARRGGGTDWYALAFNNREQRHLGEELAAFVGPSWSTFRGQAAELDPVDPIEAAIQEFTGGHAFKFRVSLDEPGFRRALEQMRSLWAERPSRIYEPPRPTGRVLRDFLLALAAGDRSAAEYELGYLRDHHRQDERNLLFLRVRMLDAFRRAEEILTLEELPLLLQMRRPAQVSLALLRAIYRHELQRFEAEDDPAGAIQRYQRVVRPRFGALWAVRRDRSPEVIKAFMLEAVAGPEPDKSMQAELLAMDGIQHADRRYLARLVELATGSVSLAPTTATPSTATALDAAEAAGREGDYARAFALVCGTPPSKRKVRLLGECAFELQALDVQRAFLETLAEVPEEDRRALLMLRSIKQMYEELMAVGQASPAVDSALASVATEVPRNWGEWFAALSTAPSASRALELANQGANEWSPEELAADPNLIAELETCLQMTRSDAAESILRDALPHLLRFFQRDSGWPREAFRELYGLLRLILMVSSRGNDTEMALFDALMAANLGLGMTRSEYAALMVEAKEFWRIVASPARVPFALEWLDTLLAHPCPSDDIRADLLVQIAEVFQRQGRLIEADQWLAFRTIVQDYGLADTYVNLLEDKKQDLDQAAATDQSIFARLGARTVLLYCVNANKVRRAEEVIRRYHPTASISVCSDGHGSPWLRQKAKEVDIVILDWTAASHAASDCITHNRSSERPTLYPRRGNFTALVEALRTHLESVV